MLNVTVSASEKRQSLVNGLHSGTLQRYAGAFSPLVAMLVEDAGFEGVYVSGAALSADLGLPDIGLTTLTEVAGRGQQIAGATNLPVLIDADTGFGEPINAGRTIRVLEDAGLAGCHIEDQVNPKRCGHLDNKDVVSRDIMVQRIAGAVRGRRDPNFVICARTDARAVEGLESAIDRAKAYVDAGATMIFPEALRDESEFEAFRRAIDVPLLANMTEFGESKLLNTTTLQNLGINMVIYPVTTLRIAMGAIERGLLTILGEGTQESLLGEMQHRQRLYEVIHYEDYNAFDENIFNFALRHDRS